MGDKGSKINCVDCDNGISMNEGEKLLIDGKLVEVTGLDDIMESVRRMRMPERKRVADELLIRAKDTNDIPSELEAAYRDALMDEYDRRYLGIM